MRVERIRLLIAILLLCLLVMRATAEPQSNRDDTLTYNQLKQLSERPADSARPGLLRRIEAAAVKAEREGDTGEALRLHLLASVVQAEQSPDSAVVRLRKAYELAPGNDSLAGRMMRLLERRRFAADSESVKELQAQLFAKSQRIAQTERYRFILMMISSLTVLLFIFIIIYLLVRYNKREKLHDRDLRKKSRVIEINRDQLEMQRLELMALRAELSQAQDEKRETFSSLMSSVNNLHTLLGDAKTMIDRTIMSKFDRLKLSFAQPFVYDRPRQVPGGDSYWCTSVANKDILVVWDSASDDLLGTLAGCHLSTFLFESSRQLADKSAADIQTAIQGHIHENCRPSTQRQEVAYHFGLGVCVWNRDMRRVQFAGDTVRFYELSDGVIRRGEPAEGGLFEREIEATDSAFFLFTDGLSKQKLNNGYTPDDLQLGDILKAVDQAEADDKQEAVDRFFRRNADDMQQTDDILLIHFYLRF